MGSHLPFPEKLFWNMLDIVCCLHVNMTWIHTGSALLMSFSASRVRPGLLTHALTQARVSGLPTPQPQSRDGAQKQHTWGICPGNSLVCLKWQRRSVCHEEGRGGLGGGLVTAPWRWQRQGPTRHSTHESGDTVHPLFKCHTHILLSLCTEPHPYLTCL